jgi:UDP-glucose 6-dehydrogenase
MCFTVMAEWLEMNVLIGAGYSGLTTSACFASLGNNVWRVDIDEGRVAGPALIEVAASPL